MNTYYPIDFHKYDPQLHQLPIAGEDLSSGIFAQLEGDTVFPSRVNEQGAITFGMATVIVAQDAAKGEGVKVFAPRDADAPLSATSAVQAEILVCNRQDGEKA